MKRKVRAEDLLNENFPNEQLPNFQDGDTIILVGKEKFR